MGNQSRTYQAEHQEDQLDHICVCNGVKTSQQSVDYNCAGRENDG